MQQNAFPPAGVRLREKAAAACNSSCATLTAAGRKFLEKRLRGLAAESLREEVHEGAYLGWHVGALWIDGVDPQFGQAVS